MINIEILLRDYLKKISMGYQDFSCVHIRSSEFTADNKKEHKIKLMEDSLKSLSELGKCRFFHIFNEDFFVFFQEKHKDEMNTVLLKIKFYFADDKNIKEKNISLFTFYSIDKDVKELEEVIKSSITNDENYIETAGEYRFTDVNAKKSSPFPSTFIEEDVKPTVLKKTLTPEVLGRIENSLKQVDFSSIIRRQSVCAIFGKSFPQPLFDEVFVAISDLQEILMPDINISSSPWLFKHFTEVLDKGVLLSVGKHDYGSLKMEFSMNLNTATILSSDFGRFDDKINPSVKSTIVLELHPSDVFSDLHTFILARDYAKSKGYRICVDNMSIDLMRYLDKDRLGVDMVKLFWSPEFYKKAEENKNMVIDLVKEYGEDRVVLSRVDDAMGVDIGQSVGISLFQGRHINSILSSDPRKRRVGSVIMTR